MYFFLIQEGRVNVIVVGVEYGPPFPLLSGFIEEVPLYVGASSTTPKSQRIFLNSPQDCLLFGYSVGFN